MLKTDSNQQLVPCTSSDNGGEFIALREFLTTNGISHLTTPPHTPEHNGMSERKHRHVVETGLTLMSKASVPKQYWPYAFATAVYLINRLPTPVSSLQSPYQKLLETHRTTLDSVCLAAPVSRGFALTHVTNLTIAQLRVCSLGTPRPKVPIFVYIFPQIVSMCRDMFNLMKRASHS